MMRDVTVELDKSVRHPTGLCQWQGRHANDGGWTRSFAP